MYCYHCGYNLDVAKVEKKQSSFDTVADDVNENATITYICPRCGHLIRGGMTHDDSKELARASHAQIQRGANSFAIGMCLNVLGLILLALGILFYILAKKPAQGFVLQVNCPEFYVSMTFLFISVILLGFGIVKTIIGIRTKSHYTKLLKEINNQTFVQ